MGSQQKKGDRKKGKRYHAAVFPERLAPKLGRKAVGHVVTATEGVIQKHQGQQGSGLI